MWPYPRSPGLRGGKTNRTNCEALRPLAAVVIGRGREVLRVEEHDQDTFDGLREFTIETMKMILSESVCSRVLFTFRRLDPVRWEWEKL